MTDFFKSFGNSLIVTLSSTFLIILCSSMASYIIARNMHSRVFRFSEKVFLAAIMVPFQVFMVPLYKIFKDLGLMNQLYGVIIELVGLAIPFATFMYIGFVKTVPRELEESAIVDGAGPFRTFWQIVFPLLLPITSSLAALEVLWVWNDFGVSIILLQKAAVKTTPLQQYIFFGKYASNYNDAFASALISMIPVIVFFLFAQKYIVKGLIAGAVKG